MKKDFENMNSAAVSPLAKSQEFELNLSVAELKDIVENKMRVIEFNPTEAYEKLSDKNKIALSHLVKAANILNDVFLKQDHPDNIRAREILKSEVAKGTEGAIEALTLFTIHNGVEGYNMYAQKTEPLRLFKSKQLQSGRGFYPQDITKQELAAYVAAHPEQASALLGNNTIVRRQGERLIAEPYSVAFREEMEAAAREILLAAAATDHKDFAEYLYWQAQALVNDSDPETMFKADKFWTKLESAPLEFTVSRESYKDGLSGDVASVPEVACVLNPRSIKTKLKDSIGVRVGIINSESYEIISSYRQYIEGFSQQMPLKEKYKKSADEVGKQQMAFADVDLVSLTGDRSAVRGGIFFAQNLPNEDKLAVQLGGGKRMVFHRQIYTMPEFPLQKKFLDIIVSPEQRHLYDKAADFYFIIGHETAGHSLGPSTTFDGRDKKGALGNWGNLFEENKADLISMAMADYLCSIGKFTAEQTHKIYFTWVANQLPKKQPSDDEAHRKRSIMQLNYFRENGAMILEKGGKLSIVPEKMANTARKMLAEVILLQLEGNLIKAEAFINKYGEWNDALRYCADEQMKMKPKLYLLVKQPMRDRLSYPIPAPGN